MPELSPHFRISFNFTKLIKYLPGIVLAFLSSALRFAALRQTTFANGWDGYFYLVQLKSWVEEGSMHSADQSLIYPLMKMLYWGTGDYISTFKLTAALLAGLSTFAIFHLAKRWSGSMYIALLIGSISLFSPHLTYFAAQYPKNLLGFVLLLFFMASLTKKAGLKTIGWLLLCFFGHRLTFGIAIIFGLLWLFLKKFSIKKLAFLLTSGLIIYLLSLVIPGLPNISDLQRFNGLLSMEPQFAPYSFMMTFGEGNRVSVFWLGEIMITSAIYFLSIPFLQRVEKSKLAWILFGISTLLLFPFFKWELTGMAYRFFLLYILLAPLFLSLLLKIEHNRNNKISLVFFSILFMLGSIYSLKSYQPAKHDADYKKYAQLTENTMKHLSSTTAELVIAHNALAEYFTFTTGIDAMPWNPEYEIAPNQLWRIATDIRRSEMEYYLSEKEMKQVYKINVRYFLLPDYLWQKILENASKEGDQFLIDKLQTWRNPNRLRPAFLLNKKSKN